MAENIALKEENFDESVSTFGDRLVAARAASGMSVENLAAKLGVEASTLENWETNEDEPRANRIQTISGLLNISVIWLITGESNGTTNVEQGYRRPEVVNETLGVISEVKASLLAALDRIEQLEKRIK
ncbi:MAG: helix-turn-helix transcriptional regulator [Cognatishimia sp.]|uniref:helix-turn-helix domain-containing protein n=1 Tax=Cognatishimia sp. TaxID=2211648 RepID=UPI003B8E388E